MSSWDQPLTGKQAWLFCCAVLTLHVTPLLMADMPMLDDIARQHGAFNDWMLVGRPLMVVLNAVLGFGPGAVNLYPLPLLLAVVVTSASLVRLVQHWFRVPTFSSILVVLPLWLQPFFLQNLSYQYDGAGMALSLACAIWAVTLDVERLKSWLAGVVMIAAGAALYQPSVSVAAGLCGIEVIRQVMAGKRLVPLISSVLIRLGQLMAGTLLFVLSCSWMLASRERSSFLVLDGQWYGEMLRRLALTTKMVDLLLTPWISWLCLGLLAVVLVGLRRETLQLWRRPYPAGERLGLGAVLWLTIPLIVACIPGILLFLAVSRPE